jgi:uncharacterized membrane protein
MDRTVRALAWAGILVAVTALVAASAIAQEGLGGEAGAPLRAQAPVEPVDSASLMPALYLLTAVVGGVAALVTVLLAVGVGDLSQRQERSEGERRLLRLLKEGDTGFTAGRPKPPPGEKT